MAMVWPHKTLSMVERTKGGHPARPGPSAIAERSALTNAQHRNRFVLFIGPNRQTGKAGDSSHHYAKRNAISNCVFVASAVHGIIRIGQIYSRTHNTPYTIWHIIDFFFSFFAFKILIGNRVVVVCCGFSFFFASHTIHIQEHCRSMIWRLMLACEKTVIQSNGIS